MDADYIESSILRYVMNAIRSIHDGVRNVNIIISDMKCLYCNLAAICAAR